MPQTRFFEYLDDDLTISLDHQSSPFFPPGRYYGFDLLSLPSNSTNIILGSSVTGYKKIAINGSDEKNSVFVTRQGVVVMDTWEFGSLSLPVSPNSGTLPRVDLVIATHRYLGVDGGFEAVYSIVEGAPYDGDYPPGDDADPALPTPNEDVIIGRIWIPGGTVYVNGMTWIPAPKPSFGLDETIAYLDRPNVFTKSNRFAGYGSSAILAAVGENSSSSITLEYADDMKGLGNFYVADLETEGGYFTNLFPVAGVTDSWKVTVFFPKLAKFGIGGNIKSAYPDGQMVFAKGTHAEFVFDASDSKWYVVGGYADVSRPAKWRDIFGFSGVGAVLRSSGKVDDGNDGLIQGNLWNVISGDGGANTVKFLQAQKLLPEIPTESGRLIIFNIEQEDSLMYFIHDAPSVPTGYKPLWMHNEENRAVYGKFCMLLVETETHYKWVNFGLPAQIEEGVYPGQALVLDATKAVAHSTPGYIKEAGLIRMYGQIRFITPQPTSPIGQIATLEPDYRPSRTQNIIVTLYPLEYDFNILNGGISNGKTDVILRINTAGVVSIMGGGAITLNMILYLDGISFNQ